MAFCPRCRATMGDRDTECRACGYDFPPEPERPEQFSLRWMMFLTLMAAFGWLSIRHYGADGAGLTLILTACGIVGLQQKWALPSREEIPGKLLWGTFYLAMFAYLIACLGIRGVILGAIVVFAGLFARRWE